LIAFILFSWWSPTRSLTDYLQFHAAMAIVAALVSVAMVHCILSPTRADCVPTLRDIREGAGFSIMRVADTALNALDKTVVLHLAGNHSAGIYSAAYRLISVASLPLVSLSMSVLPRLFRAGTGGIAATPLVRGLLAAVLAYGIFAGMVVWSIAGLLPVLLGEGFRPTVEVARWLAISPLLQGLYIIGANLLVTQNMVGLRVIAQSLTIGVMVFSAIFLIPAFGLAGAAGMLLVTQAFAAILIWSCYALGRRQMIRRDLTTQETQGVEGSSPPAP
jgi:O-antigen/teichoic acid export membrane protein